MIWAGVRLNIKIMYHSCMKFLGYLRSPRRVWIE